MLIVAITILNIAVAVALPLWSYVIRRDREEETIFRGMQYAEAIRVFRQRNGRYPASLEELVKIEPRSIRQLWTEPLSKDGEFGLVVEAPPQQPTEPGAPGTPGAAPTPGPQQVPIPGAPGRNTTGGFGVGGSGGQANLIKWPRAAKGPGGETTGKVVTQGPLAIHGVYLDYQGESLRKFFGKDKYEQWTFAAELIPPPVTAAGRPLPRVRDDWLGKSFPDGLGPAPGSGTGPYGSPAPGTQLGGDARKPGQAPGGNQAGKPAGSPKNPAPDLPEEPPADETMHQEEATPADEEPPPEDLPDPDTGKGDRGDGQGGR